MSLEGAKLLITGASGMLASDLIPRLEKERCRLRLTDIREMERDGRTIHALDITNIKPVREFVQEERPQWIINCAAFTAVDDAEKRQNDAFLVNATGPANLAKAAKDTGARLLHISTDYVFGGKSSAQAERHPYTEEEPLHPCGIYGQSKRYGDELVQSLLPEGHLIVRTSWLHGRSGPNFVASVLKLAKERQELAIVSDQIGSPTWSDWLAGVLVELVKRDARGIFNATSRGNISWFDFAGEITRQAGLSVKLRPQTTEELARPAPRPRYSTLDVTKLESFLGEACPSWQEGIRLHLAAVPPTPVVTKT